MSTATLAPGGRVRSTTMFASGDIASDLSPRYTYEQKEGGSNVLHVENIAVFRSGQFRDSLGEAKGWDDFHMQQMVSNYDTLKNRNIFVDIPVRDGHPGFLMSGSEGSGKVVGYVVGLRVEERTSKHDGKTYSFLVADYDILDVDAQQKISSGLWRSWSSEIGTYISNDEMEFWPVYYGLAYVDIPAVEGLKGFSQEKNIETTFIFEEENMSVPTPPVTPQPPAGQHAAPADLFKFSIGGKETTDFSAVQSYIENIEKQNETLTQFQQESIKSARKDFVNSLAEGNKILASQIEDTEKFALGLSDEQFDSWKKIQESATAHPTLGNFEQGIQHPPTESGSGASAEAERMDTLKAIVAQHKRSNMPFNKIKETGSYKELISLDKNFNL